jgi:uncharacterized protein YqgC (DUF456 family)
VVYVYAVVLTVLNLMCWVGILFNLPGTWLMVLVTALLKWWLPAYVRVSWTMLGVAAGLAVLGEVLEFVLGAAGSRQAGGSTRAAALAIVGSLVGGIIGTALPVPVVGTLIGAWPGCSRPADRRPMTRVRVSTRTATSPPSRRTEPSSAEMSCCQTPQVMTYCLEQLMAYRRGHKRA